MRRALPLLILLPLALLGACAPAAAAAGKGSGPQITFYFGLERPEAAAQAAFSARTTPGSSAYRQFQSPSAIARDFGASKAVTRRFKREIGELGLRARVDASRVFARVSGTRRELERAFHTKISSQFDNDPNSEAFTVKGGKLRLPKGLRPLTSEVVPVFIRSYTPAKGGSGSGGGGGRGREVDRGTPDPAGPANEGTFSGCAAARATGAYSFDQLRTAYGADGMQAGKGASIAILNVGEGIKKSDIAANGSCFGLGPIGTRTLLGDGQKHKFGLADPAEPQEDLALARALAPQAAALTFTQIWVIPDLWFIAPAQLLDAPRLPDTFSMSYAYCERDVVGKGGTPSTRAGASLMDSILLRLGLAGTGTFASAGDSGSTCNGQKGAGVAWPASSPYATSVGGTRLVVNQANARVDEVVWNDGQWLTPTTGGGAGGGGVASATPLPDYQRGLPDAATMRMTPDVSAHASQFPAFPINFAGEWLTDGGTSAASPLLAGGFARLSANERAAGRPPLGPVNGLLYALETSEPDALFDVTEGNNGFSPKVPAEHAGPGYDLASGLGVPRFDRITAELPPPAP